MKSDKLLFRITYRYPEDTEVFTWEGRAYDAEHAERLAFGYDSELYDGGEFRLVSMHYKASPLDKWEDSLS